MLMERERERERVAESSVRAVHVVETLEGERDPTLNQRNSIIGHFVVFLFII